MSNKPSQDLTMKNFTLLTLLFLFGIQLSAQSNENTLDAQFTDVIEKSNRYQDYKVVKIFKLNNLKKSVGDSIAALETVIDDANGTIDNQKSQINTLTLDLKKTQDDLVVSKEKEDGIEFFGSITKKSTYNTIMWSIIGLLLLITLFLFYKFKNSNSITRMANTKLAEIEEEFEGHRQKTLEREQQLRRKLQDEINKNK